MKPEDWLLGLQRSFFAALNEPLSGESRQRSWLPEVAPQARSDVQEEAARLLAPAMGLSGAERLEIYRRQYWYRLLDSIEEDFPVLRTVLGRDRFFGVVEQYLIRFPSGSFTLRHLGHGLAAFLAESSGMTDDDPMPAELAALEFALCDVLDGALGSPVSPHDLPSAMLGLAETVRLFALKSRAAEVLGEARPEPLSSGLGAAAFVAVSLQAGEGRIDGLSADGYRVLVALREGGTLEHCLERAARVGSPSLDAEAVREVFALSVSRGWIVRR